MVLLEEKLVDGEVIDFEYLVTDGEIANDGKMYLHLLENLLIVIVLIMHLVQLNLL